MKSKMSSAYHGSGHHSPPTIGRTADRVFEEAQFTGEVFLNGRKLRDYPKLCAKYDLSDTVLVDISRNRLTEVPHEVCEYLHVERINCYHNVIKSIPDTIQQLQTLTHINLSRNQLSVLPPALCVLGALEVLSASNNKLVSLPEEIGQLKSLMDLDVSCNEISHLPLQIGDMSSLRCLNLRKNKLVELPVEISRLQLYKIDFSSNRIEKIPTVFRKMETLEQFVLDHNPLSSPPANICIKGKQHIMKLLHIEAMKEDRKRGVLINSDADIKRFIHKSLPPQQSSEDLKNMLGAPESKWKRHTVLSNDSGYSTGDGSERNGWQSGEIYPLREENNNVRNDIMRKDRNRFNHYHSYQPFSNQYSEHNQQHYQNSVTGSGSIDAEGRSRSGSGFGSQLSSSAAPREQIYSETYGGALSHLSSRSQNWYPNESSRTHYRSQPHVSSSSNSQNTYNSSSSTSSHVRTTTPSPSFGGYTRDNASHSLNNSFNGSDTGVALSRHRSNTSLSDYEHRHHSDYSHLPPHAGSRSYSPSLRYENALPSVDRSEIRGLSSPPRSQAPYASQREYSPIDRNVYRPLSNRLDRAGAESPPVTPPTPIAMTEEEEDQFTRELKRQKAEYERKKKQAELIRAQQEEEEEEREKEERRRAALKLQEDQRMLKEEQLQRRQEDQRVLKEELLQRRQEELKRQEAKKREEEMHKLQEESKSQSVDETESKLTDKNNATTNNFRYNQLTNIAPPQHLSRPQHAPPLPPPPSSSSSSSRQTQPPSFLPVHGLLGPASPSLLPPSSSSSFHMSPPQQHQDSATFIINDRENRNALSSQSFKEQRRLPGGTQYRRAASDTLRTTGQPASAQHQVDNLNYINRNGVVENSSASTTPSISPSPSPRSSVSHLAKPGSPSSSTSHLAKPISPSGSTSHLVKPTGSKSSVPRVSNGPTTAAAPAAAATAAQSQAVRRTRVSGDRSNTSSPVTARSTKTAAPSNLRPQVGTALNPNPAPSGARRSSNSSTTDDDAKPKKGPPSSSSSNPLEASRMKSRLDEQNRRGTLQNSVVKKSGPAETVDTNKRINTRPPANIYAVGRGRPVGSKGLDEPGSNFSARRKEEKEESEQIDRLRQTVESRLRVTLPDNLAEALRDGVVLCHLANQIRPRSVGSIHVPSPAVPKLTLAKCRRNVDNFLDACKKIGVDQEQLCGPQDIFDEKGITRVAITVAALVAIGTNPRQSAV